MKRLSGFSLVELMVVVGVIGILSAVAVPQYRRYQVKSKTSEAKIQLGAIFTAEQSYNAEYLTYASCLTTMGYDPREEYPNRFYAVGFAEDSLQNAVASANGGVACNSLAIREFPAGRGVGAILPNSVLGISSAVVDAASSFTAGASGFIIDEGHGAGVADQWIINEKKQIRQTQQGY
ncbi:MAG: prepilin-type N-terminal cleavage/methylation domain-containing protein [Oligoflexia bacterium]|nr:prepilin-type N-terminal cleavage/methylation domain-containing protein [Oligoflexia bacterium]